MFRSISRTDVLNTKEENLLEVLSCPNCKEYMTAPIALCENGHNVCPHCKPKIPLCQTCRGPILELRNVSLETLARDLEVSCKFQKRGCGQKLPVEVIKKHESVCSFKPYDCPLHKYLSCSWSGQDIKEHVYTQHPERLLTTELHPINWEIFSQAYDKNYTQVLLECGELFLYHRKYDSETKIFTSAVQFIGLQRHVSNYKYDFELCYGNKHVKMSCGVHSDQEDLNEIYASEKCVKLNHELFKQFVDLTTKSVDIKIRIKITPTNRMLVVPVRRVSL